MHGLREQLQHLHGRVCYVGLGNVDYSDDGFGVCLAGQLVEAGVPDVVIAGTTPEHDISRIAEEVFDHVVFLDAVEFGGDPGSAVLLHTDEIAARFPQVSTHRMSLSVLAKWVEANGRSRVWLLGVQPESVKCSPQLTPGVQRTLEALSELLRGLRPLLPDQRLRGTA
jgi:hydrogenase 3 maturation protease